MSRVTTKARLHELESKRDRCKTALARAAEPRPLPTLHPNLAKIYRRRVANLETALNDPICRDEAAMVLRDLIDAVVLYSGDERGEIRAELFGELAALLQLGNAQNGKTRTSCDVRVSLVAGKCNQRDHNFWVAEV